jgi:hypothetical protein
MTGKAVLRRAPSWPEEILEKYQPAIKSLRRDLASLPAEVVCELEDRLIEECEHAVRAVDRFAVRRRADIASVKKSIGFVKAARTLASFMQQFPDQAAVIVGDALFALRGEGLRFRIDSGAFALPANAEDLPEFIVDKKPIMRVEQAIGRLAAQLGRSAVEHNPARSGPSARLPMARTANIWASPFHWRDRPARAGLPRLCRPHLAARIPRSRHRAGDIGRGAYRYLVDRRSAAVVAGGLGCATPRIRALKPAIPPSTFKPIKIAPEKTGRKWPRSPQQARAENYPAGKRSQNSRKYGGSPKKKIDCQFGVDWLVGGLGFEHL